MPDIEEKMRQLTIEGNREWLTDINSLLEDRNARVEESVVVITITTVRATASAIFISIRPTIAAVTKASLNFTELVHNILFDKETEYIRCLLLLIGAV